MAARVVDNENFGQKLGLDWKSTKILGSGSFGIVSLWEYHGDEYLSESIILDTLAKARSKHIVRQYRKPFQVKVPSGGLQIGLYLEYCPCGDLDVLMDAETDPAKRQPGILERDLWDLFLCLSLAVSVMARGTEDKMAMPVLHGIQDGELVHYE
ncbi:hypothetical protein BKA61DRAFT_735013 [Leptodontidium sp. MPI-SDFR-AT-0119]|nr:hypothetical protein BKA61DRAFT_735013 [Leptodontidium sp. MPI-SDFR-AT-0119]